MTRRIFNKRSIRPTVVQPINTGGTNAADAAAAGDELHLVQESSIGVPNGVVPLDENEMIPNQYLPGMSSINGDTIEILGAGDLIFYSGTIHNDFGIITNYDCQRVYDAAALRGNVSLVSQVLADQNPQLYSQNLVGSIVYEAPVLGGVDTIAINSKVFDATILQSYIEKPVITEPNSGVSYSIPNFTIYITPYVQIGYQDVGQIMLECDFATDSLFQNIVRHSLTPAILTQYMIGEGVFDWQLELPLTNVAVNNYYVRVRYVGTKAVSDWSDTHLIDVYYLNYPNVEESVFFGATIDIDNAWNFGFSIDLNNTGDTLIVGSPYWTSVTPVGGKANIFKHNDQTNEFVLQKTLTPTLDSAAWISSFGSAVCLADNGNLAFVYCSEINYVDNVTEKSAIYVYKTSTPNDPSTFDFLTSFLFDDIAATAYAEGTKMCVSDNGSMIAITSDYFRIPQPSNPAHLLNYVKLFKFENNTITFITDIIANDDDVWTEASVALNSAGNRLLIAVPGGLTPTEAGFRGAAYIYDYDGTDWNLTTSLVVPLGATNFGLTAAMSGNGETIAIGDFHYDGSSWSIFYTYEYNGAQWNHAYSIGGTPGYYENDKTITDLELSDNGELLFVARDATHSVPSSPTSSQEGSVEIYTKSDLGSDQFYTSKLLIGSSVVAYRRLGYDIAINSTGTVLVASSIEEDVSHGSFHVFK